MKTKVLNGLSELSDLLKGFGIDSEDKVPETTPLQKTMAAIRKHNAAELEHTYAATMKAVGDEMKFSSTPHLIIGLAGLLSDAVYTLWDPVQQVLKSPVVSKAIKEKIGEDRTLTDYIVDELKKARTAGKEDDTKAGESEREIRKAFKLLKISENYALELTAYCQKTGKDPEDVLNSKRDMVGIINKTYGSVDKYAKIQRDTLKKLPEVIDKLDSLQKIPFGALLPLLAAKLGNNVNLADIGVDPAAIGGIVQDYVKDCVVFSKAFMAEHAKYTQNEVRQYQTLDARTMRVRRMTPLKQL